MKREAFGEVAAAVGGKLGQSLARVPERAQSQVQEIRVRAGRPVLLCGGAGTQFLREDGALEARPGPGSLCLERREVEECFRRICGDSVYSHQNEIRNGYLTLRGGHRAGICGTAVLENGRIETLREVSSLNLRIAREVKGCASGLLARLGAGIREGLLLAGPPSSGKTTLLRDLARQLSLPEYGCRRVALVDERGELAACCLGTPQNDVGFCDVLDGYPKGEGILQAVRALSPDYIVCDEIGGEGDCAAVRAGLHAGAAAIASIHAAGAGSLMSRRQARELLQTGAFGWVALLGGRETPCRLERLERAGDLLDEIARHSSGVRSLCAGGGCGIA